MQEASTRRQFVVAAGAGLTASAAGCLGSSTDGGDGEQITLRHGSIVPGSDTLVADIFGGFVDKVQEYTDGQVEVDLHPGGELADGGGHLRLLRNQSIDIALIAPNYHTDQIPLSNAAALPFAFEDLQAGTQANYDILDMLYEKELEPLGIRPVLTQLQPAYQILTKEEPYIEVEDWAGKNVRSNGGTITKAIEALGASAVEVTAGEIYSSLNQGVADSTLLSPGQTRSFSLEELINHISTNVNMGTAAVLWCVNEDTWGSLPSNVQDAMNRAGSEMAEEGSVVYNQAVADEYEVLRNDFDINTYEVPPGPLSEWNEQIQPVIDGWVDDHGQDGDDVWTAYNDALERHS